MVFIWNTSYKKSILLARHVRLSFFELLLYQLPEHAIFVEFLVSEINYYHINWLYLFSDSFEWFCLEISSDEKYFPLVQGIVIEDC